MLASAMLTLTDYGIFASMLLSVGGVIAAMLAANLKALSRRIEVVEQGVKELERSKTAKHDWAREAVLTRNKLDRANESLARLEGKLDNSFGVAAVASRIADELKKSREARDATNV